MINVKAKVSNVEVENPTTTTTVNSNTIVTTSNDDDIHRTTFMIFAKTHNSIGNVIFNTKIIEKRNGLLKDSLSNRRTMSSRSEDIQKKFEPCIIGYSLLLFRYVSRFFLFSLTNCLELV